MASKDKRKMPENGFWIFFWVVLFLMLIANFVRLNGVTYLGWRLFLHIGIIIFSFLILLYSLKLNEKATNFLVLGSCLWIILNSLLILSYIFEEYVFLQTNLLLFLGLIIGFFMFMKGFKEAIK